MCGVSHNGESGMMHLVGVVGECMSCESNKHLGLSFKPYLNFNMNG